MFLDNAKKGLERSLISLEMIKGKIKVWYTGSAVKLDKDDNN